LQALPISPFSISITTVCVCTGKRYEYAWHIVIGQKQFSDDVFMK